MAETVVEGLLSTEEKYTEIDGFFKLKYHMELGYYRKVQTEKLTHHSKSPHANRFHVKVN